MRSQSFQQITSWCLEDRQRRDTQLSVTRSKILESQRTNPIFISVMDQALSLDTLSLDTPHNALFGLTFAVKDNTAVQGLPCSLGCDPPVIAVAERNASIVDLLLNRGASCLGTTNVDRLCLNFRGANPHYGTVSNPLFAHLPTGGSSSGSAAAVASGLVDFSTGTDFGGSIRLPAALCGICGLKLSAGAVESAGAFLFSTTLDSLGVFTKELEDLKYLWQAFSGGITPGESQVEREQATLVACHDTLESEDRLSGLPVKPGSFSPLFEKAIRARKTLATRDATRALRSVLSKVHLELDEYRALSKYDSMLTDADVNEAELAREEVDSTLNDLWGQGHILLTPTLAHRDLEGLRASSVIFYLTLANLCGLPALSFPAGKEGNSQSWQLIGPKGSESLLIDLAIYVRDTLIS